MSTAALEQLVHEQRALIAALDADDPDAVARHTAGVQDVLTRIRAFNARIAGSDARRLAEEAMVLTEAARVRVNVLADMTQRRLTRLAAATGRGKAVATYGRTGRLSC